MVVWCLGGVRWGNWDWVGPPCLELSMHATTHQNEMEAPRLLKLGLSRICCFLVCVVVVLRVTLLLLLLLITVTRTNLCEKQIVFDFLR